ncbi:hypothetical protein V8E55_003255 [Tylopilus felleus]
MELDAKLPEHSMLYFPTDELWMQVMLPPKQPPIAHTTTPSPKPSQPRAQRPPMRQMMLDSTIGPCGRRTLRSRPNAYALTTDPNTTLTSSNAIPIGDSRQPRAPPPAMPTHHKEIRIPSSEGWD